MVVRLAYIPSFQNFSSNKLFRWAEARGCCRTSWSTAMRLAREGREATAKAQDDAKAKKKSPESLLPSNTREVVEHLRAAARSNGRNSLVVQAYALGLLEWAKEPVPAGAEEGWQENVVQNCSDALKQAITLNPHDLKNYYHLAWVEWSRADYMTVVESLDAARALQTMDFDDDLQQVLPYVLSTRVCPVGFLIVVRWPEDCVSTRCASSTSVLGS